MMSRIFWAGKGVMLAALLISASCSDIRNRKVSDFYSIWILLLALLTSDIEKWWGIFCGMPFLIAALTIGGIGGADVKIMGAAGMVLGFWDGILALIFGVASMLLFHMIYLSKSLLKKNVEKEQPESYPMVPFLSIGIMLVYLI